MNRFLRKSCVLAAACVSLWCFGAKADEENIKIDQLPKAVVEGIMGRYAKATLVSAEKETQGDKTFYEVNIKHEGRAIELLLTPEGKIVTVEQPIAAKDLPKEVAQAIQKKYPKGTIKHAEETTKEDKSTYAVLLENDVLIDKEKQKVQLQLTTAGEITASQKRIDIADLPKAVTEAVRKKYPHLPITRVNEIDRSKSVSYLIALENAEKRIVAELDSIGKILKNFSQDKKK